MNLSTPVEIEPLPLRLGFDSRLMFVGSCFADSIGEIMREAGFNAAVNPFGVVYNPVSVANSFERMRSRQPFGPADVVECDGLFTSFYHHSRFSRPTAEEFLSSANASLEEAADAFDAASVCVVTLGTTRVFRHIARDMVVSNCHKINPREFSQEMLSLEQCVQQLERAVAAAPDKRWIFTVSPIRYLSFGAHCNQICKSTLLLAVDEVVRRHPSAVYFPAYEIMMDELRDYRFYDEDMAHPSHLARELIFERFCRFAVDPGCYEEMRLHRKRAKAAQHRKFQFGNHSANE